MRVTIKVDSATPAEVFALTEALGRTVPDHEMPGQVTRQATVTVLGTGMGWESPALKPEQARKVLDAYNPLAEWEQELMWGTDCK